MKRLLSRMDRAVEVLINLSLFALFALALSQVVFRYIFSTSLIWSEEVARFILVWFTFMGGTIGLSRLSHITIGSELQNIRKGLIRPHIRIFLGLLVIVFLVILTYKGTELCVRMRTVVATSVPIPMWFVFITVPINGFLMLIFTCNQMVNEIRNIIFRSQKSN